MRLLKLVRTGIPGILNDVEIVYQEIPHDEFVDCLRDKLFEEVKEYLREPSLDELADVYEAVRALARHDLGSSIENVESTADVKVKDRGGFDEGIGMYLKKR